MTDFLVTADASKVNGADFFRAVFGGKTRDRALEAEYLESLNAHWAATKAESDAIIAAGPREGESRMALLKRALAPLNAHEEWRREQGRAWSRGEWQAPEARRRAA